MENIKLKEESQQDDTKSVASYGLLVITNAYNEGEITFEEWVVLSRKWALQIIAQYKNGDAA